MKAYLEPYIYGDPPVTKLKKKRLACGHWRGHAIISKSLDTAWCWDCQKRVKTVRVPRLRILTRRGR